MKSADWAAWVQAIGSIGAIIGTYHLADRTYRRERQADHRGQLLDSARRMKIVIAVLAPILAAARLTEQAIQENDWATVLSRKTSAFQEMKDSINSVSLMDIPDAEIALKFSNTKGFLDAVIEPLSHIGDSSSDDCLHKFELLLAIDYEFEIADLRKHVGDTIEDCSNFVKIHEKLVTMELSY